MFVQSKATEDEDVDYVEEGTSNVFPDTAGDSLDNAEIIVQEKEFYLCYHYKNGKILIYHGKTSNPTDGKLEDLDPNGYLELVEKGQIILNSRQLKKQIILEQAQKIIRLLHEEELI